MKAKCCFLVIWFVMLANALAADENTVNVFWDLHDEPTSILPRLPKDKAIERVKFTTADAIVAIPDSHFFVVPPKADLVGKESFSSIIAKALEKNKDEANPVLAVNVQGKGSYFTLYRPQGGKFPLNQLVDVLFKQLDTFESEKKTPLTLKLIYNAQTSDVIIPLIQKKVADAKEGKYRVLVVTSGDNLSRYSHGQDKLFDNLALIAKVNEGKKKSPYTSADLPTLRAFYQAPHKTSERIWGNFAKEQTASWSLKEGVQYFNSALSLKTLEDYDAYLLVDKFGGLLRFLDAAPPALDKAAEDRVFSLIANAKGVSMSSQLPTEFLAYVIGMNATVGRLNDLAKTSQERAMYVAELGETLSWSARSGAELKAVLEMENGILARYPEKKNPDQHSFVTRMIGRVQKSRERFEDIETNFRKAALEFVSQRKTVEQKQPTLLVVHASASYLPLHSYRKNLDAVIDQFKQRSWPVVYLEFKRNYGYKGESFLPSERAPTYALCSDGGEHRLSLRNQVFVMGGFLEACAGDAVRHHVARMASLGVSPIRVNYVLPGLFSSHPLMEKGEKSYSVAKSVLDLDDADFASRVSKATEKGELFDETYRVEILRDGKSIATQGKQERVIQLNYLTTLPEVDRALETLEKKK